MGTINKFFTSDTHFDHRKLAELRNMEIRDMNEMMVERWNEVVGLHDHVYHLGDFAWRKDSVEYWFNRLNGHKHLIIGNHDLSPTLRLNWESQNLYVEKRWDGIKFVMFHYPILEWNGHFHGAVHLYGHVHTNREHPDRGAYEVGVDANDFYPVSLDYLLDWARRNQSGETV